MAFSAVQFLKSEGREWRQGRKKGQENGEGGRSRAGDHD